MDKRWVEIALEAAKEASQAIMQIYATDFSVDYKKDKSPVTIADKTSSDILIQHLTTTGIPIICEEEKAPRYEERKDAEYIWIVDPLDGTKEFIRKNDEFCICIALVHKSLPIFGLIASPTTNKIILGGKQIGAYHFDYSDLDYLNQKNKIEDLSINHSKTVAYSRTHFTGKALTLIEQLETKYGKLDVIQKGSALKFFDLVLGRADFYPRMAPTMEWDIAAGQAIYETVGGEVLDFTNFEPLKYNKENLYNSFFIAKNRALTI